MRSISRKTKGQIFAVLGLVCLGVVIAKNIIWIVLAVAGYKLLSEGLKLQGYPPILFFFTRWFF